MTNERPTACADEAAADRAMPADARMQAIWRTYADPLLRFLQRLSQGRQHNAEDLLQETLMRAWRHIDNLPDDVESLGPWLYTVARRVAIDAARARQVRPAEIAFPDHGREPVAADMFDRVVAAQVIRDALPRLIPEHRSVVVELYLRQHSTRETALRLGIPEGTVKSRVYYALRALSAVVGTTD
ncbi:sigma-70 family RNA polymerase sigma factor [Catellatospora methionotrophica]|uniref:sigma-70 family RNA polymerase sigma factor n=1 Tax=Catellatospora methionotrophica TaxID=121620 RepID=UPI0033D7BDF3